MYRSGNNLVRSSIIKAIIIVILALTASIILGIVLSNLNNMEKIEEMLDSNRPSLPSVLYDRHGEVITEFYSDEKRDMVSLDMIPEYLVQSLIVWEDESFFHHYGFNPIAIMRAAINNARGKPVSGASTLTQQLATTLFLTKKFSYKRKLKELWIAFQLEKKYTKNEILTLYLNHVPLGAGLNGVQAASKFYFQKDVNELTYAEAASIVTIISNPTFYSFTKFPKNHKTKQRAVLNKMVLAGVITKVEAEKSLNEFWINWQTREDSARGAFYNREDKAPFFSDWVLNILEKEVPNVDVFKDGLRIYSTLDLNYNQTARTLMDGLLEKQQKIYEDYHKRSYEIIQHQYIDAVSLFSQTFSLSNMNVGYNRILQRGIDHYSKEINPSLNMTSLLLNLDLVNTMTDNAFELNKKSESKVAQVQGAFIVIDNKTGQILTMVGGRVFDPNNRFNYAMQGRRQPGSSFKPFVYSAALDTHMYNAASVFVDKPTVFTLGSEDPDEWYTPANYGGLYMGRVSFRRALRRSLNIPAVQIYYDIGKNNEYKVPLDRAAKLLGINSQSEIDKRFGKEISAVLGTGSVSPIEMVSAFSVFANLGQKKIPNSILYVEDRDGNVIYSPWKELDKYYRDNKNRLQIISPQNAYIMTDILKGTVHSGDGFLYPTRARMIDSGKAFPDVELAAKTGTTSNFSDTWLIGFSPEITAGGWVGFKEYGLSLGFDQSSVAVLGPTWVEFMRKAHLNKEELKFKYPGGLNQIKICRYSGRQPSEDCEEDDLYYEYFLPGSLKQGKCNICKVRKEREQQGIDGLSKIYDSNYSSKELDIFTDEIEVDKSLFGDDEFSESDVVIDSDLIDIDLFDSEDSTDFGDFDLDLEGGDPTADAGEPAESEPAGEPISDSADNTADLIAPAGKEEGEEAADDGSGEDAAAAGDTEANSQPEKLPVVDTGDLSGD